MTEPAVVLKVGEQLVGTYLGCDEAGMFKIRRIVTGDVAVIRGAGNLSWQMQHVEPGRLVKIERERDMTLDRGLQCLTLRVSVAREPNA